MVTEVEFKQVFDYIQKFVHGPIEGPTYTGYKEVKKPRIKKIVDSTQFEELWSLFPGKASFEYNGKKFTSEQAKKGNYQLCKEKYQKILDEGRFTHQQILQAMLVEVQTRKIESYKTGKNVLHYMNGLQPWLNGQKFEVYIGEPMPEIVTGTIYTEA